MPSSYFFAFCQKMIGRSFLGKALESGTECLVYFAVGWRWKKKKLCIFLCRLIAITVVYCVRQSDWNTNEVFKFNLSGGRILKSDWNTGEFCSYLYWNLLNVCKFSGDWFCGITRSDLIDVSHLIGNNFLYHYCYSFFILTIFSYTYIQWFPK